MEITSSVNSSITRQSSLKKTLGKDDFLRLFTSQLKYQDPLKPLESTEFTSQLAQFSSLEQLFNINNNIDRMVTFQQSLNNGIAMSLIGKTVTTEDNIASKVTGIAFDNGITYLMLENGTRTNLSQIKEITQ